MHGDSDEVSVQGQWLPEKLMRTCITHATVNSSRSGVPQTLFFEVLPAVIYPQGHLNCRQCTSQYSNIYRVQLETVLL